MTTIRGNAGVRTPAAQANTRTQAAAQERAAPQATVTTGHSTQSTFEAAPQEMTREEKKQVLDQVFGKLREKIEERYKTDGSWRTKQAAEKMMAKLEDDILSGRKPLDANVLQDELSKIYNGSSASGKIRDSMWKMIFNQILEQFQKRNYEA
jgi:C-terminal processing protease CtpA/Prc